MSYNLLEDGYEVGQTVYHVMQATVRPDGEPEYDLYGDEWLAEAEWEKRDAAAAISHTNDMPVAALETALKNLDDIRRVLNTATYALRESVVFRKSLEALSGHNEEMKS